LSRGLEELAADAASLQFWGDVKIVEEGAPAGIGVEEYAGKSDKLPVARKCFQHDPSFRIGVVHPGHPEIPSIDEYGAIQECIRQEAAIRAAPALRMELGDVVRVRRGSVDDRVVGYRCSG
jgi:hypothetical protein